MSSTAAPARQKPTQRVLDALTDHGPLENGKPWDEPLNAEQRQRALTVPGALRGAEKIVAHVLGDTEHPHEAELEAEHEHRMATDPEYRAEHDAAAPSGDQGDVPDEARAAMREPTPEEGGLPPGGPSSDTRGDDAKDDDAKNTVRGMLEDAGLAAQTIRKALAQAEITIDAAAAQPSDEMRERFDARKSKSGLTGAALGVWILTGNSSGAQAAQRKPSRTAATGTSSTSTSTSGARPPREGSAMHAAITVLKAANQPLTPQEIYDRAVKRGLAGGLKGKTPVATLGAQLATANKKGTHVERPEPGKYRLRGQES